MESEREYGKTEQERIRKRRVSAGRVREGLLILLVLTVFCSVLSVVFQGSVKRPQAELIFLSDGWYYVEDGVRTEVELPAIIKCGDGTLELCLDGAGEQYAGMTVTTRGAQYSLEILLDDEILYDYEDSELFPRNAQMKSKLDCDAVIPSDTADSTLKLRYQSDSGIFRITEVCVGDGQTVAEAHYRSAAFMLAADVIMIVLGVIAAGIGVYLYCKKMQDGRFWDLAVFFIICAVWRITDSSLVQNGSAYPELVCVVSFYMFMLLAPPMLHFLQRIGSMEKYRILDFGIVSFYVNAAVQGFLNCLGVFTFIQMLFVTHILLAVWVFISVGLLLKERREAPGWETTLVLFAFLVLGTSGVLALLVYWVAQAPYYGDIFEAGIIIFIVLMLADAMIKMVQNIHSMTEMRVYLRLQREDWMTGLQTRKSFEEALAGLQPVADKLNDMVLIFIDINHLRQINEEFGRTVGDGLVVAASRCIERVFGKHGICYRLDGEEFAVLLSEGAPEKSELFERLDREIDNFNLNSRYRLSLAKGSSHLRGEDGYLKRFSDWKYEADEELFRDRERYDEGWSRESETKASGESGREAKEADENV